MKRDLDYMAKLLAVFTEAPTPLITFNDIEASGITVAESGVKINDTFYFNFQILVEERLVSNEGLLSVNMKTMGFHRHDQGLSIDLTKKIRRTTRGDDFALALENKAVLSQLKAEFKSAPFGALCDMSKKLLEHYLKKKIDELVKEG